MEPTEFNIVFSTCVEPRSVSAYDIYEEHGSSNSNVFAPSESMVLYIEPVAFGHRQILLDDDGNTHNIS